MGKLIDKSEFWLIKDNPITKTGVFPYLGAQIGQQGLDAEKIYYVLRPAEELFKPETVESFNGIPITIEHAMLGSQDKGLTKPEDKGIDGVTLESAHQSGDKLLNNIRLFSEQIKDAVNSGKKELSAGYYCDFVPESGDYHGQHYDFVQRNIFGNHIALVDKGRSGSEIRVMDSAIKSRMVFDSMDLGTFTQDWQESEHPREKNGQFAEKGSGSASSGKSEEVKTETPKSDNKQNKEKALNAIKADENFKTMEKALNSQSKITSDFDGDEYTPLEYYDFFNYYEKDSKKAIERETDRRFNKYSYELSNILEGDDINAKKELIENEFAPEGIEEEIERYNDDNGTELTEEEFLNLKSELTDFYHDDVYEDYDKKDEIKQEVENDFTEGRIKSLETLREKVINPISEYVKTLLPKYGFKYKNTDNSYTESTYIKFTTPEKLTIEGGDEDGDERDIFSIRLSLHGDRYSDAGKMSINLKDNPESIAEKINIFLSKPNKDYRHDKIYYGAYDSILGIFNNFKNSEDKPMEKDLKTNGASGQDTAPEQEEAKMDKREVVREIMAIAAKPETEFKGGEEEKVETIAKLAEKIAYNPSEAGANDKCAADKEEDKEIVAETVKEEVKPEAEKADEEKEKEEKIAAAMDAMEKRILANMEAKNSLIAQLTPVIGAFDSAKMTVSEIAKYACDKLKLTCATDEALPTLKGFLAGKKQEVIVKPAAAMDSANTEDEAFKAYMEGK